MYSLVSLCAHNVTSKQVTPVWRSTRPLLEINHPVVLPTINPYYFLNEVYLRKNLNGLNNSSSLFHQMTDVWSPVPESKGLCTSTPHPSSPASLIKDMTTQQIHFSCPSAFSSSLEVFNFIQFQDDSKFHKDEIYVNLYR